MKVLLTPLLLSFGLTVALQADALIEFGQNQHGVNWQVINDGVMGGLSEGQKSLSVDSLHFRGEISLENNGGFSSLKAPFVRTDLSGYQSVEIRYKHQGHPMALTFEWHPRFYKPYHKVLLPPTAGVWKTFNFDLDTVLQYRMGKPTGKSMSKKDLQKVIRLGFIASEKQESKFDFEVDYIKFVK